MVKIFFCFLLLFLFLENASAKDGANCDIGHIIEEGSEEINTVLLPKVEKGSATPSSLHEIVEINGEQFYVIGDEDISFIMPSPSPPKKSPLAPESTMLLGTKDIEYLPSFLRPIPKASSPPSLPVPFTVGISPELKIVMDQSPAAKNYFFANPEGKLINHVSLDKNLSNKFYLQSNHPLLPEQFARYTRSQGKEIKLIPFTKEVDGEIVHIQGGLREVYVNQVPDDYLYKRMKGEAILGFSPEQYAYLSKREVVFAERANQAFAQTADDIGIAFEVEPHDYSYTHVGYWRIKKVPGVTLHEYRQGLSPEALKEFNHKLQLLQEKIKYENKIAGRMANRYFDGSHAFKGIPPKDAKKILSGILAEAAGDEDKFVDLMAERGYLADIDTGRIHFGEDGLGHEKDMNNCHVYEIKHKGKMIPKFHCYDI